MLNWLICYLNYNGNNFSDSNIINCSYHNSLSYECNYIESNYQHKYVASPQTDKNSGSNRNDATISAKNNRQNQLEATQLKALEAANLKTGLKQKIEETNKGYEMVKNMGYLNGEGLGKSAESMSEPLTLEQKSGRNGLELIVPASEADCKKLSKSKRKRLRRKARKDKEAAQKQQDKTEYLQYVARTFNAKISLMQSRLAAEAALNHMHSETDLVVAKIYINNNQILADRVFEYIRSELVGWIGIYQQEGLDTPIFHCISNNDSHITLVCDNIYSFECLERCIENIVQMKILDSLIVARLPLINTMIYCYDAMYEGLANDADLFLLQLRLHKPKLHTENWVVASHEVCTENCKTFFFFLIDERSALALNFQYSRSFFVCMQQVTFRNSGVINETILN